jgi:hypothetical protein
MSKSGAHCSDSTSDNSSSPPTCHTLTSATYKKVASSARNPSSLQKATDLCTCNFMLDVDSHDTNLGSLTKYKGHYENK